MMQLIEKVIRKELSGLSADISLSFLKYSTGASGKKLEDKVIFFVFKQEEKTPFLCVKTVRNYAAADVVRRNFDNLNRLNELTSGSPYQNFFAKAIYLHDDGENIFSMETASPGKRVTLDSKKLAVLVERYTGFQAHVAGQGRLTQNLKQYVEESLRALELPEGDRLELLKFYNSLSSEEIVLPKLVQHGDLTEDNIIFSKSGPSVIDCDYLGVVDIPGFDLFGLFYRHSRKDAKTLCHKYLPDYFEKIGAEVSKDSYLQLFFLYYLLERTVRKRYFLMRVSAFELIAGFKKDFL